MGNNIGYTIRQIDWILSNYWLIRDGHIPAETESVMSGKMGNRSPFESAAVWAADIDLALSNLDDTHPENWSKISVVITKPVLSRLLQNFGLCAAQKKIIRYYLLDDKYTSKIGGALVRLHEILNKE